MSIGSSRIAASASALSGATLGAGVLEKPAAAVMKDRTATAIQALFISFPSTVW
jgi:hypothetical protein